MATSKLFDRITTCSLAIRHVQGIEDNESSYSEVMSSASPEIKMTKYVNTNLTKACMEFIKAGFVKSDTPARKVKIAMCVVVSIAEGRHQDGLIKAICDRFRGLEDYDRHVMTEIFNLSMLNDRVLQLLDNAMISKKENIQVDITHEFRAEFILIFFGIVESALRREEHLDCLGYITRARPSEMKKAREILEKHLSSIATMCGTCFKIGALKKERERINLFPSKGGLPTATIGREHIGFDEATVDTLKECLFDTDKKGEFLDIIFAIISHSHKQPGDTFAGIKTKAVRKFFIEKMLDQEEGSELLKSFSKPAAETRPGDKVVSKALVKANREIVRIKQQLIEANKEISDLKSVCEDQKKQQLADANREKRRFKELTDELTEKSELLTEANEATTRIENLYEEQKKQLADSTGQKPKRPKIDHNALYMSMSGF